MNRIYDIATDKDLADINSLRSEIGTGPASWSLDLNDIKKTDNHIIFLDRNNNQIIGYLSLHSGRSFQSDIEAEFEVFVHPQYRRKGIGTRLINDSLQYSKDCSKLKRLIAKVLRKNDASIRMCQKVGFCVLSEDKRGTILFKDVER